MGMTARRKGLQVFVLPSFSVAVCRRPSYRSDHRALGVLRCVCGPTGFDKKEANAGPRVIRISFCNGSGGNVSQIFDFFDPVCFWPRRVRDPAIGRTVLASKTKHTKQYTTPCPTYPCVGHVSSVGSSPRFTTVCNYLLTGRADALHNASLFRVGLVRGKKPDNSLGQIPVDSRESSRSPIFLCHELETRRKCIHTDTPRNRKAGVIIGWPTFRGTCNVRSCHWCRRKAPS